MLFCRLVLQLQTAEPEQTFASLQKKKTQKTKQIDIFCSLFVYHWKYFKVIMYIWKNISLCEYSDKHGNGQLTVSSVECSVRSTCWPCYTLSECRRRSPLLVLSILLTHPICYWQIDTGACACVRQAALRGWGVRVDQWTQALWLISRVWAAWLNSLQWLCPNFEWWISSSRCLHLIPHAVILQTGRKQLLFIAN